MIKDIIFSILLVINLLDVQFVQESIIYDLIKKVEII